MNTRGLVASLCGTAVAAALVVSAPGASGSAPRVLTDRALASSIRGITGEVGVVIATDPIGTRTPLSVGNWSTGAAWSTSKVPIAIAALERYPTSRRILGEVEDAIRASSNAAAHALWLSLGRGRQAAWTTDRVLRALGDLHTTFRSSSVGLSRWSLSQQTIFGARLACSTLRAARIVHNQMRQVVPWERWGLGSWPHALFKGGWGPDSYGRYTVRQIGLLPYRGRWIVVALGVIPSDGSFATGADELTEIGDWLWRHASQLPSFSCTVRPKPKPTPTPTPSQTPPPKPTPTPTPPPKPTPTSGPTPTTTSP